MRTMPDVICGKIGPGTRFFTAFTGFPLPPPSTASAEFRRSPDIRALKFVVMASSCKVTGDGRIRRTSRRRPRAHLSFSGHTDRRPKLRRKADRIRTGSAGPCSQRTAGIRLIRKDWRSRRIFYQRFFICPLLSFAVCANYLAA